MTTKTPRLKRSASMLDRPNPSAEDMAKEWIGAFDAAVAGGSEIALSELFVPDSHWRNLLGVCWHFATLSGSRVIACEMGRLPAESGIDGAATGYKGLDHLLGEHSAPTSPSASAASGDLMQRPRSFATCGREPASPACGSPAARSRKPESTAALSRCRSRRSRRADCQNGRTKAAPTKRTASGLNVFPEGGLHPVCAELPRLLLDG
jgi:hypothetical protein